MRMSTALPQQPAPRRQAEVTHSCSFELPSNWQGLFRVEWQLML